jgi:copper(I)-binding protein
MKIICTVLFLLLSTSVNAADTIEIKNPWVNQTPPSTMSNAGYMEISNTSGNPVILQSVISPQFGMSHIHQTKMENGLMKMTPIHGLEIPANESVILEPGGIHIMMMNRSDNLSAGDVVEMTLVFSDGQKIPVKATVK